MNSQDVSKIIETICNKFGIAANSFSDFVPELAKYKISTDIFMMIVSAFVVVLSIMAIWKVFLKVKESIEDEDSSYFEYEDFPLKFGGILILIFTIRFIGLANDLVGWISSPQASAVNYVLSYFE